MLHLASNLYILVIQTAQKIMSNQNIKENYHIVGYKYKILVSKYTVSKYMYIHRIRHKDTQNKMMKKKNISETEEP